MNFKYLKLIIIILKISLFIGLLTKNFEKVLINKHDLYLTNGKCWDTPSTCVRNINNLKILKKNNYIFYIIKK